MLDRPIDNIDATHIARTNGYVVALIVAGSIESWQILGIVTEVGIHLEDVVVVTLQRPLKASYVCRAKTKLSATFDDEKTIGEFLLFHHLLDNRSRSVRGTVVDDENMKTLFQGEYRTDNLADILHFVVGRYDDNTVALMHRSML